jgi:hypothetical protein
LQLNCEEHSPTSSSWRLSKDVSGSHLMAHVWWPRTAKMEASDCVATYLNPPYQHFLSEETRVPAENSQLSVERAECWLTSFTKVSRVRSDNRTHGSAFALNPWISIFSGFATETPLKHPSNNYVINTFLAWKPRSH